jgi:hypothetical protein
MLVAAAAKATLYFHQTMKEIVQRSVSKIWLVLGKYAPSEEHENI